MKKVALLWTYLETKQVRRIQNFTPNVSSAKFYPLMYKQTRKFEFIK